MNKTLYIREEDAPVWDRARELAGEKLSPVIVEALKRFVAQKEAEQAEQKGFERILIEYDDALDNYLPKKKAFYGRWIIPYTQRLKSEDDEEGPEYAVAVTAKGNWVVYLLDGMEEETGDWRDIEKLLVYNSRTAAAADMEVNYAIHEAVKIMGVPVEELDI